MNNLVVRAITALIAGSIAIFIIVFSPYGLWLFCALLALLGLWEFYKVVGIEGKIAPITSIIFGAIIWLLALRQLNPTAISFQLPDNIFILIAILIFPMLELIMLFQEDEKQPIQKISMLSVGFVYCFLPFFLMFQMSISAGIDTYDFRLPLGILFLTWMLDTSAYFVGRFMGKNPLFPRVSPKKTWEGAIGGGLFCIILGIILQLYMPHEAKESFNWIFVACIIAVFSQFGDLVESMFKRSVQLKDSGTILPGHGGILDRFDGVFLSIPFIYFYYSLV